LRENKQNLEKLTSCDVKEPKVRNFDGNSPADLVIGGAALL